MANLAPPRIEALVDIGCGTLCLPWIRRSDEGRALAAVDPVEIRIPPTVAGIVRQWEAPMVRELGAFGHGPGQLHGPIGLAISPEGLVVVCDALNQRVQILHQDGTCVRHWGNEGTGAGQFLTPYAVALTESNHVLVTDMRRLQLFQSDGTFVRSFSSAGPGSADLGVEPVGVAVHGDLVFFSDQCGHTIQCFRLDGTFVCTWGNKGSAHGLFNEPVGLAVASFGRGAEHALLVCDSSNHRVQVFGLNGTFQRIWGPSG